MGVVAEWSAKVATEAKGAPPMVLGALPTLAPAFYYQHTVLSMDPGIPAFHCWHQSSRETDLEGMKPNRKR